MARRHLLYLLPLLATMLFADLAGLVFTGGSWTAPQVRLEHDEFRSASAPAPHPRPLPPRGRGATERLSAPSPLGGEGRVGAAAGR